MLELAKEKHAQTNRGVDAMVSSLKSSVVCAGMTGIIKSIVAKCPLYLKTQPLNQKKAPLGVTKQGKSPRDCWQVDFSELPRRNRFRCLLVLIDTFSGWPKAFPCRANKAKKVVIMLLKEIIPRFELTIDMSSDRGPHFIAEIVQQVSKVLKIN